MSHASQRLAYKISEAANLIGVSRSKMYMLIAENKISARKLDGRTIILHADLQKLIDNAPRLRAKDNLDANE